jgi:hypothetical protein
LSSRSQANSSFTPLFIGTFLVLVVLVAINMFIAILTDFYEDYKEEKAAEHKDKQASKGKGIDSSVSLMKHAKIMWAAMTKPQWRLQVKNVAIAGQNAALLAAVGQPMRERTIVVQVRKRSSSFRSNEMP